MMAGAVLLAPSRRTQEVVSPMPHQATCSVPDCNRPRQARDLCKPHGRRLREFGDVQADVPFRRVSSGPLDERFASFIRVQEGCWEWTGHHTRDGYAGFWTGRTQAIGSRWLMEWITGTRIPDGLTIDHLCTNTGCVRFDHLEVVTKGVNTLRNSSPPSQNARKITCKRGHDLATARIAPNGSRQCRECVRLRSQYHRDKRKAAMEASS